MPSTNLPTDETGLPLDEGIKHYVQTLHHHGIETFESCEGGDGHCFPEPTIRFYGDRNEGFKALAIASQHAFPVSAIKRTWPIVDGEPTGPCWEITFYSKCELSLASGIEPGAVVAERLAARA